MRQAFPYLMVAPAVIFLLAITLYPGVFAIYQSLYVVKFVNWTWAGLDNYRTILGDREFWAAMGNTAIIGGISLTVQTVIALAIAYFAYRDPFVRGWRILFLMPMLFMPSAVAFIWKLAFNDGRVVSDLLGRAGLLEGNVDWLASVWLARLTLIVADVWQWTPFLFIIFVAALQSQDQEIEEAARLDGASWPKVFWNISLPMMRPVIVVAVTLRGIDITTMFTNVFIMTQGSPGGATETMSYFIYRQGFRMFNFGYASAASVLMLILTVVIAQTVVKRAFRSGRA
jgi:multiple sugar transport system permease protein